MGIPALYKAGLHSLIVLIGLCSALTASVYGQDVEAERLFQRGLREQTGRPMEETKQIFRKVVRLDPRNDQAWFELAKIAFAEKNYSETEAYLENAIKAQPEKPLYWISMGDVYKASEQFEQLVLVFDRLIELEPDDLTYRLDKAYALSLTKAPKKALKVYRKAVQTFGLHPAIVDARNAIYLDQGQPNKAIADIKKLIKQQPTQAHGRLMLAQVYLDQEQPEKALRTLTSGPEQLQSEARVHLAKSAAWGQLKEWDSALGELRLAFQDSALSIESKSGILLSLFKNYPKSQATEMGISLGNTLIQTHPEKAEAYAVYGDMLLRAGKKQKAAAQFGRALELNNKMVIVWEEYLQLLLSLGENSTLQEKGRLASQLFPSNELISLFTGYGYMFVNQYKNARPYLENALNHADPKNKQLLAQIYSSLGALYNSLEMHEVSDAAFDESLAIDSNNAVVLNNYAYFLTLRQVNLKKALSMGRRANTLSPNNATFQDTYAWTLFHKKQYDEALVWIEKAIGAPDSVNATMLDHYGDILLKVNRSAEAVKNWKLALKLLSENQQEAKNHIVKKINETIHED